MRVLAIGGSGGMGRHAVSLIQSFDAVIEITVADLNESSANSFAAEMNSRVSAIGLDVNDSEAMSRAMQNADIVINTSGPFYRFGVPILRAAINEGCNYLDICDDSQQMICNGGLQRGIDRGIYSRTYMDIDGYVYIYIYIYT